MFPVKKGANWLDLRVSGEKGHSTTLLAHYIFWFWLRTKLFSNAGYQNCSKMIRDLTFVVQFAYFSIRPKKGFRILEQLLSKFHPKKQLLIVFWVTFEQLLRNSGKHFGKSQATCGKPHLYPLFMFWAVTLMFHLSLVAAPTVWILESLYVSGKLPTYPSPKLTLSLTSHLVQNVGLRDG